ncbi:hypothetical protein CEE99_06885 [Lactobacillus crispatus]|jgi:hypothetical protein|uniref:hypothetical protein n=2 Tax=Lactobacillus crispatus TaxID=47770 RepID=UPI00105EBDD6|nr:hypothetical protein [Lactobacillus crispatus]TDM70284.1 hypothetical protein CEF00_07465 [Lactobacillus crispatus]TDM73224.1 hypothetical protein CEE99_06885 [Lactobacillus crispatus]
MDKFKDTIITDAGRKLLINVGAGNGEIAYTRAVLAGQDVSSMADEDIRKLATLENQKMEVNVIVTPPQDNTITVSASFGNKDLTDDLTFSSVGWYAKNNNDNKEILLGVSPSNGEQTLAAGSPDHRSTASIDIDLAMAISNAAKVDLTVNEIGVAHMSDVNAAILKLKAEYDPKIEQAGKVKGAKINDGAVVEPDDDGILDLIVDSDRIKDFPADLKDLNDLPSGTYRTSQSAASFVNYPKMQDGTTPFNIPIVWKNALIKVVKDANAGYQLIVSSQQKYAIRYFSNNHWGYWFQLPTLSNNDIIKLIDSKVDGLNIGNYATKTDLTSVSNSAVKKVNGLTPDGSGNVNVTSTVARGFDANANATTKMTEENLHGGNQILMDQNAGQDIVNWTKGQLNGKLSNSGGDMAEHSTINWNGAGAVESHDGNIGGLTWSGATDNVRLFADNDANDNLDLVIQLGDDNSNAVVIRNSTGAQAARVDASGNISSPTINDLQRQINDLKEDNVNKQKQINDLINNVTYIKDNYVEGRRFPASQEAQAQAWENEKPTRLAMIEK